MAQPNMGNQGFLPPINAPVYAQQPFQDQYYPHQYAQPNQQF